MSKEVKFYEGEYYMLSNLSAHAIMFEGKLYPTSEHAYQASKFVEEKIIEDIRAATSPLLAKSIAKRNLGTSAEKKDWKISKVLMMEQILIAKLSQHEEVKQALLSTGDKEIAEDSPTDYFWGIGEDGGGENTLGKLWMKLRSGLKSN